MTVTTGTANGSAENARLCVRVELGHRMASAGEVSQIVPGSVIALDAGATDEVNVLVAGHIVARGHAVVVSAGYRLSIRPLADLRGIARVEAVDVYFEQDGSFRGYDAAFPATRSGGKAEVLNEYETYLGDPGWLAQDLARHRAVTPAAVQAFANKYLADDRRIELTTVPKAKAAK